MNTVPNIERFDTHPSGQSSGWLAQVNLEFKNRFDRTVIGECSRKGPLTFQRPFYPENDVCHLYLLHPPGGVVGGDRIELSVTARKHSHSLITTPGATKFYRSQGMPADQIQKFKIESTANLEWFPQETILFPGSVSRLSTRIDLDDAARFSGWEIICFGRPVNDMPFDTGALTNEMAVYRKEIPLYMDRLCIDNKTRSASLGSSLPGLQGFPVSACFLTTGITPEIAELLCKESPDKQNNKHLKGFTVINDLLIARYLGGDPQEAKNYFIFLWTILRQVVTGKSACIPRIWAT